MFHFYNPWKRRRIFVFWRFQGEKKWNTGLKWIKNQIDYTKLTSFFYLLHKFNDSSRNWVVGTGDFGQISSKKLESQNSQNLDEVAIFFQIVLFDNDYFY